MARTDVEHWRTTMSPGDTAPDLTFLRPDGTPVALSHLLAPADFLLLVFLRHLA